MPRQRPATHVRLILAACLSAVQVACEGELDQPEVSLPGGHATVGWPHYAGDARALRWSPLSDIDPDNVSTLVAAWSWSAEERTIPDAETGLRLASGRFQATPIAFGDTLFVSTPSHRVVALDGRSGREFWSYDPGATEWGPLPGSGFVHRGVASWSGPEGRRILLASRWELIALDARDGTPVRSFGSEGRVDLSADLRWPVDRLQINHTSPPVVWEDIVVVGSAIGDELIHERDPPGDVQAFDARTGTHLWRWDPVPPPDSPERESWGGTSAELTGHVNVWAPMSVDAARGLLYLPVSAPSNDWYGGDRPGDNLFAQSLVCLDIRDGTLVWYRQLVHHPLWDFDPAGPPALVDLPRDGDTIPAVVLAGKTGYLYAFDRRTGAPLWPLEERPAPASDVPGESAAATQPHPTWPEPFARQGFTLEDVVDFTPEIRAAALELLESKRLGPMFTPPSLEGTVVRPGWIGGAGWGSTVVDPDRHLVIIKSTEQPVLARLVPRPGDGGFRLDSAVTDPSHPLYVTVSGGKWLGLLEKGSVEVPIHKPPYGTLTGYDLVTGTRLWSITLGDTPGIRYHRALQALDLPPLGIAGAPGGVATASGLVFLTGGGRELFAVESRTGTVRLSMPLGAVGYSNPMTYRASDGVQYVVVAVGGGERAQLRAFSLPRP